MWRALPRTATTPIYTVIDLCSIKRTTTTGFAAAHVGLLGAEDVPVEEREKFFVDNATSIAQRVGDEVWRAKFAEGFVCKEAGDTNLAENFKTWSAKRRQRQQRVDDVVAVRKAYVEGGDEAVELMRKRIWERKEKESKARGRRA